MKKKTIENCIFLRAPALFVLVSFIFVNVLNPAYAGTAQARLNSGARLPDGQGGQARPRHGAASPMNPAEIAGSLTLPDGLGEIRERYQPQDASFKPHAKPLKPEPWSLQQSLVIFIQDAHANYDAANSIRKLIQFFQQNYGLPLVLLEGGEGPLDSLFFKSFPSAHAKEKILAEYLKAGDLSGAELASILHTEYKTDYYGVDTQALYNKNKEAFLAAVGKGEEIDGLLGQIESRLNEKKAGLSSGARNFIEKYQAFRSESLDLSAYLKFLVSVGAGFPRPRQGEDTSPLQSLAASSQTDFPELSKLIAAAKKQTSNLDVVANRWIAGIKSSLIPRLNSQPNLCKMAGALRGQAADYCLSPEGRATPVDHFAKIKSRAARKINQAIQAYQTGQIDIGTFVQQIEDLACEDGFSLAIPKALQPEAKEARKLASIHGTKIFDELRDLEERLIQTLPQSQSEREILQDFVYLNLLERFKALELLNEDWKFLEKCGSGMLVPRSLSSSDNPGIASLPAGARNDASLRGVPPGRGDEAISDSNSNLSNSTLDCGFKSLSAEEREVLQPLDHLFVNHFEFYRLARQRDRALFKNSVALMEKKKAKIALIVVGGFHAEGITGQLRDSEIPFLMITPKINRIHEGEKARYFSVMQGNRSFMKYFKGSLWDALAQDYAVKLLREVEGGRWRVEGKSFQSFSFDLRPSTFRLLKSWRDRIIQESLAEGRIAEAGSYTRYVDALAQMLKKEEAGVGARPPAGEAGSPRPVPGEETSPLLRERIQAELDSVLSVYFGKLKLQLRRRLERFDSGLKEIWRTGNITPESLGRLFNQMAATPAQSNLSVSLALTNDSRGLTRIERSEVRAAKSNPQPVTSNLKEESSPVSGSWLLGTRRVSGVRSEIRSAVPRREIPKIKGVVFDALTLDEATKVLAPVLLELEEGTRRLKSRFAGTLIDGRHVIAILTFAGSFVRIAVAPALVEAKGEVGALGHLELARRSKLSPERFGYAEFGLSSKARRIRIRPDLNVPDEGHLVYADEMRNQIISTAKLLRETLKKFKDDTGKALYSGKEVKRFRVAIDMKGKQLEQLLGQKAVVYYLSELASLKLAEIEETVIESRNRSAGNIKSLELLLDALYNELEPLDIYLASLVDPAHKAVQRGKIKLAPQYLGELLKAVERKIRKNKINLADQEAWQILLRKLRLTGQMLPRSEVRTRVERGFVTETLEQERARQNPELMRIEERIRSMRLTAREEYQQLGPQMPSRRRPDLKDRQEAGLLNHFYQPPAVESLNEESIISRIRKEGERLGADPIFLKKLIRFLQGPRSSDGNRKFIPAEGPGAPDQSSPLLSLNQLRAAANALPYFVSSYPEPSAPFRNFRRVYLGRGAGPHFLADQLLHERAGKDFDGEVFLLSQESLHPGPRESRNISEQVKIMIGSARIEGADSHEDFLRSFHRQFTEIYRQDTNFQEAMNGLWERFNASGIPRGRKPLLIIDEKGTGRFALALLSLIKLKQPKRKVEIFIGWALAGQEDVFNIPGFPEMDIDKMKQIFKLTRRQAERIRKRASVGARQLPQPLFIRAGKREEFGFVVEKQTPEVQLSAKLLHLFIGQAVDQFVREYPKVIEKAYSIDQGNGSRSEVRAESGKEDPVRAKVDLLVRAIEELKAENPGETKFSLTPIAVKLKALGWRPQQEFNRLGKWLQEHLSDDPRVALLLRDSIETDLSAVFDRKLLRKVGDFLRELAGRDEKHFRDLTFEQLRSELGYDQSKSIQTRWNNWADRVGFDLDAEKNQIKPSPEKTGLKRAPKTKDKALKAKKEEKGAAPVPDVKFEKNGRVELVSGVEAIASGVTGTAVSVFEVRVGSEMHQIVRVKFDNGQEHVFDASEAKEKLRPRRSEVRGQDGIPDQAGLPGIQQRVERLLQKIEEVAMFGKRLKHALKVPLQEVHAALSKGEVQKALKFIGQVQSAVTGALDHVSSSPKRQFLTDLQPELVAIETDLRRLLPAPESLEDGKAALASPGLSEPHTLLALPSSQPPTTIEATASDLHDYREAVLQDAARRHGVDPKNPEEIYAAHFKDGDYFAIFRVIVKKGDEVFVEVYKMPHKLPANEKTGRVHREWWGGPEDIASFVRYLNEGSEPPLAPESEEVVLTVEGRDIAATRQAYGEDLMDRLKLEIGSNPKAAARIFSDFIRLHDRLLRQKKVVVLDPHPWNMLYVEDGHQEFAVLADFDWAIRLDAQGRFIRLKKNGVPVQADFFDQGFPYRFLNFLDILLPLIYEAKPEHKEYEKTLYPELEKLAKQGVPLAHFLIRYILKPNAKEKIYALVQNYLLLKEKKTEEAGEVWRELERVTGMKGEEIKNRFRKMIFSSWSAKANGRSEVRIAAIENLKQVTRPDHFMNERPDPEMLRQLAQALTQIQIDGVDLSEIWSAEEAFEESENQLTRIYQETVQEIVDELLKLPFHTFDLTPSPPWRGRGEGEGVRVLIHRQLRAGFGLPDHSLLPLAEELEVLIHSRVQTLLDILEKSREISDQSVEDLFVFSKEAREQAEKIVAGLQNIQEDRVIRLELSSSIAALARDKNEAAEFEELLQTALNLALLNPHIHIEIAHAGVVKKDINRLLAREMNELKAASRAEKTQILGRIEIDPRVPARAPHVLLTDHLNSGQASPTFDWAKFVTGERVRYSGEGKVSLHSILLTGAALLSEQEIKQLAKQEDAYRWKNSENARELTAALRFVLAHAAQEAMSQAA